MHPTYKTLPALCKAPIIKHHPKYGQSKNVKWAPANSSKEHHPNLTITNDPCQFQKSANFNISSSPKHQIAGKATQKTERSKC